MKWIFTFIGIVMMAASCKSSKETMKTATPLYDTKWSLKKIHHDGEEEAISTKAFIRFDKAKGSAGGNGSCNSFGSFATINGNEVSFKNIFSTKMYCEEVHQIETSFFNGLQKADHFEIRNNSLLLYQDKQLLLEFLAE
jgi:heat shock protein HslJ